ncbi:MAG: hypothetical protein U0800_09300 [Isosphaeraceae bacterium]
MSTDRSGAEGRIPGLGDVVLYHPGGTSQSLAAIVTRVYEPENGQARVDLTIFKPDAQEYRKSVRHSEEATEEGCWRYRPE